MKKPRRKAGAVNIDRSAIMLHTSEADGAFVPQVPPGSVKQFTLTLESVQCSARRSLTRGPSQIYSSHFVGIKAAAAVSVRWERRLGPTPH
jgi:hypothetical protein